VLQIGKAKDLSAPSPIIYILHKGDGSRLTSCALFVKDELKAGLNVSFDNVEDWNGMREKEGSVSRKVYVKK
jgi:hypothetical protein